MSGRDLLIGWLNNAYGMEKSSAEMIEQHIKDFEDYPKIQDELQKHITESEEQAERVKILIESLGGEASSWKGFVGEITGYIQGVLPQSHKDERVKNAIMAYTAEQLEIATYLSIISAAEVLEEEEVVSVCTEILDQEINAAEFLSDNLATLVSDSVMELEEEEE